MMVDVNQWIAREDGLLQVEDVVQEIMQKAGDIVYKHHLQRRVVPYAVQRAKAEMLSVVEVLLLPFFITQSHMLLDIFTTRCKKLL
jgi:hypothetical protein